MLFTPFSETTAIRVCSSPCLLGAEPERQQEVFSVWQAAISPAQVAGSSYIRKRVVKTLISTRYQLSFNLQASKREIQKCIKINHIIVLTAVNFVEYTWTEEHSSLHGLQRIPVFVLPRVRPTGQLVHAAVQQRPLKEQRSRHICSQSCLTFINGINCIFWSALISDLL